MLWKAASDNGRAGTVRCPERQNLEASANLPTTADALKQCVRSNNNSKHISFASLTMSLNQSISLTRFPG